MSYTFYNAKVVDFSTNGAIGSDISLDLNLVECSPFSPLFSPPAIGTPVLFTAGSTNFYGILDTIKKSDNYLYSAQINNGLHVIGGVELILNDYYGSVSSVPNLVNIFGYRENTDGFGGSGVNNAGISWSVIANTATTLINNISGNSYGAPITYKGFKYKIDLSNLPAIPNYYRINSDNINLIDFIGEVCSAGGHDYFITLEQPTGGEATAGWSGTFKVNVISRISESIPGKVAEFIESAECVSSKNYGQELRKDVHSKFVVGANLERIYFNYPQDSGDNTFDGDGEITRDEYMNDTVLPFFGTDVDNNIITGLTPEGEPNEYYFPIDVSDVKSLRQFNTIGFSGGEYWTSLSELRAARKSRNSWEAFLGRRTYNQYVIDSDGLSTSFFLKNDFNKLEKYGYVFLKNLQNALADVIYVGDDKYLQYPHSSALNYYFHRAESLRLSTGWKIGSARMFESDLYQKSLDFPLTPLVEAYGQFKAEGCIHFVESQLLQKDNLELSSRASDMVDSFNDNVADKIYRKLKILADSYYNKKFMVSIPFVLGTIEPESTTIRLSQEPINEGYIDESAWSTAYSSGLIPDISGVNTLITPENKFYPFVKYENCVIIDPLGIINGVTNNVYKSLYDFSEISENDKIFSTPVAYTGEDPSEENNMLGVNPGSGFLVYDCWIKCSVDEKPYFHDSETLFGPRAIIEIPGSVKRYIGPDAASYSKALMELYEQSKAAGGAFADDSSVTKEFFEKQLDKIGGDDAFGHDGEPIQYANLYAIPLRSKLLCYGPWYAIGASGKVSYERNTDLNPWNYGGFSAMNQAGLARVEDGITNQTFSEVGSVTVQGLPTKAFGDPLIANGPYITSISSSIGGNGQQTTYSFQTWSSHRTLSKLNGYSLERNKNLSRTVRDIQSNFREGLKNGKFKNAGDFYSKVSNRFIDLNDYTRRDKPSTSSKIISAEMNGGTSNVVIQPNYNAAAQAYSNYEDKALVSLDGLFRPYSTVPKSGWPSFEQPESSGSGEINSLSLNPTQSGHDFSVLSVGNDFESGGLLREDYYDTPAESGFVPARSMGLRLPAVGVGWGYDTTGNPVPSGTGENGFATDYLHNSKNWKAGPIDLKWDESRKVWTAGGGGTPTILFEVVRVLRGVGLNCNAMECDILNVSCSEISVSAGDTVTVYDEIGCVFNAPEHLLLGRRGYAIKMSNPSYRMNDPLIIESGTEDIAAPSGSCRWCAQTLCCVEEET